MRSGKDGEYYFITIESDEELEKLKELTLKKIRARNGKLSYASRPKGQAFHPLNLHFCKTFHY